MSMGFIMQDVMVAAATADAICSERKGELDVALVPPPDDNELPTKGNKRLNTSYSPQCNAAPGKYMSRNVTTIQRRNDVTPTNVHEQKCASAFVVTADAFAAEDVASDMEPVKRKKINLRTLCWKLRDLNALRNHVERDPNRRKEGFTKRFTGNSRHHGLAA